MTPAFLQLLGQLGANEDDAAHSSLLQFSVFDLVRGKSDSETKASRKAIRKATSSGKCASMPLELCALDVTGRPSSLEGDKGTLQRSVNAHFAPLEDMYKQVTAYIIVVQYVSL